MIGSSPRARGTRSRRRFRCARRWFIPASAGNTWRGRIARGARPVHPRERGEHVDRYMETDGRAGSSPRARGTLDELVGGVGHRRFIPASAGNTLTPSRQAAIRSVHPRERGEHRQSRQPGACPIGSSPRARGTRGVPPQQLPRDRFIPASAGNTAAPRPARSATAVHPRERGEHLRNTARASRRVGSSPRARGTRPPPTAPRASSPVHPRERGEHDPSARADYALGGSSPRARGTQLHPGRRDRQRRFIPASAGNTCLPVCTLGTKTVHPRERGEHTVRVRAHRVPRGSSPRARGTRRHPTERCLPPPVHPRERGEHRERIGEQLRETGSSPRARGTPGRAHAGGRAERFIPASAGNTWASVTLVRQGAGSSPRARGTPSVTSS